ncbi:MULTISPECIES: hybrid sensor histidine kinase/response regulator [Microbulbifer]|uniref:hybrid sensor histidine kinase/response regulator n=1 Tax=Microbulbifer TaxID=48073 RepID=UPI001CD67A53|nr:Hpt domain-containing protein [Microbulbifer agarilyticus]MCA0899820.1 Hpt domain-containing protein [Microbulbifer agarilyticus]
MSHDNPNFVALDWLIGEINETLAQARQQLETFASDSVASDNSSDVSDSADSLLKNCLSLIHQVHGSLHMAELTGAAMLAEEMEQLVQALASGEVENSDETREFLMRALLELPLYLEKIAFQRRDNAVLLLPLLNDLRAVRRERLITEGALFSPDLSALEQVTGQRQPLLGDKAKLQELVTKLRKMYHVAAASLIRDVNSAESLAYLGKVSEKMALLYSGSQRQHLWEIVLGLLEGIADHRVNVLPALRQLLRRIDIEFRLLAGQGARVLDARPDRDLIRNLLFYVYLSGPNGPRTSALYQKFALDRAVPGTPRPDNEDALAMGPEAMGTAVAALREELASVREALDPSISTAERAPLSDTAIVAKRIADTLGVLGLENQRTRARSIYEYLRDASRVAVPDDLLMQAASELVQLDSGLAAAAERDRKVDSESPLMGEATEQVLREARIGLETVKEAVVEYIASHWDAGHLAQVPKRLQEVCGGLEMVGYGRAAEIVGACRGYIEERLINAGDQPDWKLLDTLADAVTSVEYYLERRSDGIEDADMLLALAEESVATLGYAVADGDVFPGATDGAAAGALSGLELPEETVKDSAGPVVAAPASDEEAQALDGFALSLELEEEVPAAKPTAEADPLAALADSLVEEPSDIDDSEPSIVIEDAPLAEQEAPSQVEESWFAEESAGDPAPVETVTATETAAAEHSSELVAQQVVEQVTEPPAAVLPPLDDDDDTSIIDDEIVEIFLEEAGEVLETINHYFPLWAANFGDRESLVEFRRGFHTLKGSGRMVEALEVGELSWAVENMLNRVLDETIAPARAHVTLIETVLAKLPSMVDGFRTRTGDPDPARTAELEGWAKQLSQGQVPDALLQSDTAGTTEAAAAAPAVTDEAQLEADENAQLWEIFAQEAETHLATVAEYLADMQRQAPVYDIPSDPFHRALHTLKGSAHMAEVTQVAELMAPLERFAKELRTYQVAIDSDTYDLISDGASYVREVLQQIYRREPLHVERSEQFLARVAELQERAVGHLIREREANEPKAVDPQLLAVIMADGMKVLLDADEMLNRWRAAPGDRSIILPVAEELDVLQQAAGQAQLPTLQELANLLLAVYRQVIDGHLEEEPALWASLEQGHNELLDLVDAVAASTDLPQVSDAVGEALRTLAQGDDSGEEEDIDLSEFGIDASEFAFDEEAVQQEVPPAAEIDAVSAIAADDLGELGFDDLVAEQQVADDKVVEGIVEDEPAELELVDDVVIDAAGVVEDERELTVEWLEAELSAGAPGEPSSDTLLSDAIPAIESEIVELQSPEQDVAEPIVSEPVTHEPAQEAKFSAPERDVVERLMAEPAAAPVEAAPPAPTAAVSAPQASSGEVTDAQRALLAEIDPDVVEVFLEEASDLMDELEELVQNWEQAPDDNAMPEALKRVLHTFKGGARMAALMGLGEVAHRFETVIENMQSGSVPSANFFADAHGIYDRLAAGVETVQAWMGGEELPAFCALLETQWADAHAVPSEAVQDTAPTAADEAGQESQVSQESIVVDTSAVEIEQAHIVDAPAAPTVEAPPAVVEPTQVEPAPAASSNVLPFVRKSKNVGERDGGQPRNQPQEMVRVASELLEELVNLAGETSISRGRLEEQVSEFGLALDEMDVTLLRLNEQLRRLDKETEAQIQFRQEQDVDFDPLEMDRYSSFQQLSRSLLESTSDLLDLRQTLGNKARDTETLLLQQSRVNTELQEGLMRSRMVPFSRLVPRLRRIVRQVSAELGKQVDLVFSNVEGELDRSMLERMVAPLEHMLRNAVDHGIESPQARRDSGKPERGRIAVAVAREGSEVVLTISDDGSGINLMRVREKAIESGLMRPDAELSNNEIMQFILQAGFSTADQVTQISGRGVGMDVVSAEIKQIGGSVTIGSQAGQGTEFVVRLPFTVSVNRALMVKVGDDLFAMPLNTIEGIVRLSPFELEHYYRTPEARFEYAGEPYQVNYFGSLLQSSAQPRLAVEDMQMPVLLVRSDNTAMALQVDAILGSREIVVKSLGPQFAGVQGVSGATVTGDGTVVVILDAHALLRKHSAQMARPETPLLEEISAESGREEPETQKLVMVVDDSVTVRKVTTRFLEREGFQVITAKDGQDAIIQLQDVIPDVMLLDIEMPRMDGFEVARNIRSSSRLRDIPIIMITSRTGKKHRDHALSLGVNHYLGKPYQEEILLEAIRDFTEAKADS